MISVAIIALFPRPASALIILNRWIKYLTTVIDTREFNLLTR